MGGDEEEQWTYVAGKGGKNNRKNDKRSVGRRRGRNYRNNATLTSSSSRAAAKSSFYASSSVAKEKDGQDDSNALAKMTEEQLHHIQNGVARSIVQIMEDLEGHPYVTHLLQALTASGGVEEDDKDDDTSKANKEYGEIVCYGIGNFLPPLSGSDEESYSFPRYPSAPMLQLALALVGRKHLAINCSRDELKEQNDSGDSGNMNSKHQGSVKMLFFEPLMTDLERTILKDVLFVDIIETNERGKRQAASNGKRTLFYMPHCPMRLYSNVLWANWGELLWSGNVVVYGNNFHGYDDRILSNEGRTDPTNAVLKIIPHLVANQIDGLTSKAGGGVESDLLVKMENAFNDCVVMTFDAKDESEGGVQGGGEGNNCCFPDRPKEHVFDE